MASSENQTYPDIVPHDHLPSSSEWRQKMKNTPQRDAINEILKSCVEKGTSFKAVVEKAGYSRSTAVNDRKEPGKIPLNRMLTYMQILGIKEITIRR